MRNIATHAHFYGSVTGSPESKERRQASATGESAPTRQVAHVDASRTATDRCRATQLTLLAAATAAPQRSRAEPHNAQNRRSEARGTYGARTESHVDTEGVVDAPMTSTFGRGSTAVGLGRDAPENQERRADRMT